MPWNEPETGDVAHGVGGGYASLNNLSFGVGPVGGWQDRNHIAFANGNDAWMVSTFDRSTGLTARVEFPVDVETASMQVAAAPPVTRAFSRSLVRSQVETTANTIFAGGGHVAAWTWPNDIDPSRGLYMTTGMRVIDAGLLGMGPDGAVGYKPNYKSNGPSNVREVSGEDWQLTPGHASSLQLLGQKRAIWLEGFVVHVANLPAPQYYVDAKGQGIWRAQAVFAAGAWWICYYSGDKGIVLHPFASAANAFAILPRGDGWHTVSAVGPNTVRIAISKTEGEGPGDIWGYDIDVTTGAAVPLPFWPNGSPVTFPFMPMSDINPAAPPVVPTFSFNHPLLIAPFKDPALQAGTQYRMDDGSLGVFTEDADPTAAIADAASKGARVLIVHDAKTAWIPPAGLRKWDLPFIEFYLVAGETLSQSVGRWKANLTTLLQAWPYDCGIVPMFYCQGGGPPNELWTVSQVLDALRPLSDIVNTSMRVKVLGPFAYKRDNGITAHPELMQAFTNIKAAAPPGVQLIPIGDAPVQPPIPPVQPPIEPPKPTTPYPAASVYARTTMSVTLFEHINYAGASQAVTGDTPDLRTFGAQWNDQASSIQMPAGTTVTLFQDINYGGASLVLTESATDLRNFPGPGPDGTWNDQASSMKVAGAGAGSGERLKVGSKYVECTGGLTCTLVSTKSDASKVMVTPHDDKHFDVLFTKANKTLSIQNDGGLQSRDAGTYGAFEQLDAVTTPKPSEVNLIFRTDAGGVVGGVVLQIVVEN